MSLSLEPDSFDGFLGEKYPGPGRISLQQGEVKILAKKTQRLKEIETETVKWKEKVIYKMDKKYERKKMDLSLIIFGAKQVILRAKEAENEISLH